ncbi:ADP-ribosylation factor [Beauveria bassiana D1-5]|uniref:ADP-ribosylation factor n=1 Tax=Beauveria bassiana D1-5 TaxID=1245745 RepID=A0A0A2VB03_BEABA|nr:ADP-ribosylation factor [Beauveria bassiana D1-5]
MFWRTNERRVLLLGVDYAGKTTLLYRWLLGETITTMPTIGFNVETINHPAGYAFTVWDVGGCDKIRPLYRHYFQDTEFVIFVHHCADMERLDEQLDLLKSSICDDQLRHVPVLIVLSVQDLMVAATKTEDMAKIRAAYESLAASCKRPAAIEIFDCPGFSATTSENPSIVLDEVVEMLRDKQGSAQVAPQAAKNPDTKADTVASNASDDDERAKTMTRADDMTTADFWQTFEDGTLAPWDHYNHLKAGFFVLIGAFEQGSGVLDAAETFVSHLERLRAGNPQRFRNTTHRTMTVFWLAQLQIAAANYSNSLDTSRALQREDFKSVLLHSPTLADSRLWTDYYSKDYLFTQNAKDHWCLPDLKPLPSVTTTKQRQCKDTPLATAADADRLIGFGLTVVQQTLASKARRGPIVKAALAALQASTIRERAVTAGISPYSETQAYFWVQTVHAAVATATPTSQSNALAWSGSVESLTLQACKALYGITGDEWRAHYSAKLWESVEARMQFQPPDKKPLPNVIAVSGQTGVGAARAAMVQRFVAVQELRSKLPPFKDLAVMAAVLAQEIKDGSAGNHGVMLQSLFELLYSNDEMKQDTDAKHKRQSQVVSKALELPCAGVDGLTQRMFWVQQLLHSLVSFEGTEFGDFIRSNVHLAYKELPLVYYSPMLWASHEAAIVYLRPDRKPVSSFVA